MLMLSYYILLYCCKPMPIWVICYVTLLGMKQYKNRCNCFCKRMTKDRSCMRDSWLHSKWATMAKIDGQCSDVIHNYAHVSRLNHTRIDPHMDAWPPAVLQYVFKARDAKEQQRKFLVGFPVRDFVWLCYSSTICAGKLALSLTLKRSFRFPAQNWMN